MKQFFKYIAIGYVSAVLGLYVTRFPGLFNGSDPFMGFREEFLILFQAAFFILIYAPMPVIINALILSYYEKEKNK